MGDINFLSSITLGRVFEIKKEKNSSLQPIPMPGANADETQSVDTLGVVYYFILRGRWTGTYSELQAYEYAVQAICDGYQISTVNFYSPFVNFDVAGTKRQGIISSCTSGTGGTALKDSTKDFSANGIEVDNPVKNLLTGETTTVTAVTSSTLTLDADINLGDGTPYAVSAKATVKVMGLDTITVTPGINTRDYIIRLMLNR